MVGHCNCAVTGTLLDVTNYTSQIVLDAQKAMCGMVGAQGGRVSEIPDEKKELAVRTANRTLC